MPPVASAGSAPAVTGVREKLMAAARVAVQERGYGALSFRQLAEEVGIKSASVHYHFPTKGDLGAALARRYTEEAAQALDGITRDGAGAGECMRRYVAIFRLALTSNNRMCLCGSLNADYANLPEQVRVEAAKFTDVNILWLGKLLARQAPCADQACIARRALAIFSAVEGAQLLAHGRNDVALFDSAMDGLRESGLVPPR